MVDSNYTHLLVVTDRSGSMYPIRDDMVNGLNAFFADQAKEDGVALVDYVQFDNTYELVFEDTLVADAKAQLDPRGRTALLDAVGKSVTDLGKKLAGKAEDERPGTVIVIVVTDGFENASVEWDADAVRDLIKTQEDKWNWTFTFLGANMDAVSVGANFGFRAGQSMTYDTNNISAMTASLNANVTRSRLGNNEGYTQSERDAQRA